MPSPEFRYEDLLPIGPDETNYRLLTDQGVRRLSGPGDREFLEVEGAQFRIA